MCWYFYGLVGAGTIEDGNCRELLFATKCEPTLFHCSEPNHTLEKAPELHHLPLAVQLEICAWAAKEVKEKDPETAAKFSYVSGDLLGYN